MFTGDILFIGGTPIVWAGPLSNWVAACDLMLGMDVDVVVPGHGPLTDKAGVAAVRDYLAFVDAEATARHDAGIDAWEAAKDIATLVGAGEDFGSWGEAGRIAVNVETVYRTLDPTHRSPDVVEQFRRMAALDALTASTAVDLAVVGDGPAGLALAAAARAVGLAVVVVGDGRPWTATYGTWRDDVADLPDALLRVDLAGRRGPRPPPPRRRPRPTAIVDDDALRAHLAAGSTIARPASSGSATCAWGSRLLTTAGDVDARLVVDAAGRAAGRRDRPPRRAFGVVVAGPPAGVDAGLPTLMDLRPPAGPPASSPTFLLRRARSPTAGSSRRPCWRPARPSPADELARPAGRPHRDPGRVRRIGAGHDRRSAGRCRRGRGPVPRFGAAAGYAHPATGYSVAASLRAAPRVATAIARACRVAGAPRPAAWSTTPSGRATCGGRAACTPTGSRCCCASTRTSWRRSSTPSSTCPSTCGRRTCASTPRRARSPGR